MPSFDALIIGSGAAGLMAAITAGKRGKRVAILERTERVGKKILVSGGGRCNFTNIGATWRDYESQNPNFCRSALARYQPQDFIALVERHQIAYHEKKLGQLFCDHSAKDIVIMLTSECREAGVEIFTKTEPLLISKTETNFHITTNQDEFVSKKLIIATGGLSWPQLGGSNFGYRIAEQFGLKIIPTTPALDGFLFGNDVAKPLRDLAGISLDVAAKVKKHSFTDGLVFTHNGVSGPAILQASLFWQPGQTVNINFLPHINMTDFLFDKKNFRSAVEPANFLAEFMPQRLARALCEAIEMPSKPLRESSDKDLRRLGDITNHWQLIPTRTVGYAKAEVTRGGVDTNELSSQTFESSKVSGLYFIGEVVDVTGKLGGYNFQWAWASGHAAGMAV